MSQTDRIFILTAVSVSPRTETDIRADFARVQMLHASWKDKSLEEYTSHLSSWHEDRYGIGTYDCAYFLDKDIAFAAAKSNAADINEAGLYEYLVVRSVPVNAMYADTWGDDYHIFRYNRENDEYHEISWTSMDVCKYILINFAGMPGGFDTAIPTVHGWQFANREDGCPKNV